MPSPRKPRRRGRPSSTVNVREDDIAILSRKKGKETKRLKSRNGWSFQFIDNDDFAPYLDASWLLADASIALFALHVQRISEGRRADTGATQPPLKAGSAQAALAGRGVRPDKRGVNKHPGRSKGTMIHELLTRTKIKGRENAKIGKGKIGTAARCEIKPGLGLHSAFMAKDKGEYLFVEGDAAKAIDKAVSDWIDKALKGPPQTPAELPDFGEIQGKDL